MYTGFYVFMNIGIDATKYLYSLKHVLMCSCAHVLMCSCAHVLKNDSQLAGRVTWTGQPVAATEPAAAAVTDAAVPSIAAQAGWMPVDCTREKHHQNKQTQLPRTQ
jgi:hypothetical protein